MRLNTLFLIFTNLIRLLSENICIEYDQLEEKCSLCSIYYYNSLENIWPYGDHFPLDQCLPKKIDVLNLTIFVSSEKTCDENNYCDGSVIFPFSNLFDSLIKIQISIKPFFFSNISVYLLGSNPHYFFNTTNDRDEFMFFRRIYLNITIKTLYCSVQNISGCIESDNDKSIVFIKTDRIIFFISCFFRFESIIFMGNDIVYNYYSKIQQNNATICQDQNLYNNSVDQNLMNCNVMNKIVNFNILKSYGFFNIEHLIDCLNCSFPILIIENCEFNNLISFDSGNSLISLVNVLKPFVGEINIRSTLIQKIFFMKGLININTNIDQFYQNIDFKQMFSDLQLNKGFILSINMKSNIVSNYNFFKLQTKSFCNFSLFNFQFSNIYFNNFLSYISMNDQFLNSIINMYGYTNYFFWYNLDNILLNQSSFFISNCYFRNNNFKTFIYSPNTVFLKRFEITKTYFYGNIDLNLELYQTSVFFKNNIIENHKLNNSFFVLNNCSLYLINSRFINCFQEIFSAWIDIKDTTGISKAFANSISSNFSSDIIKIEWSSFYNIKNIGIISSKNTILEIIIKNSEFDLINITLLNSFVHCIVENSIFVINSTFNQITSLYVFQHEYSRNRTFSNVSFTNSFSGFLKSFAYHIDAFYHRVLIIFTDMNFENISILQSSTFNIFEAKINYILDSQDCFFISSIFKNILFQNSQGLKSQIIYLEHCTYSWFANLKIQEINGINFLYLFHHNSPSSDGFQIRPYLNITNMNFFNKKSKSIQAILLQTIFYTVVSNSYFYLEDQNTNLMIFSSYCTLNCFLILENLVFDVKIYPVYLNYLNIQSVSIRNCTFLESYTTSLLFQQSIMQTDSPLLNYSSIFISKMNISSVANYTFVFENYINFCDLNKTWNDSELLFGIHRCNFFRSISISIYIYQKNDLFITNSSFYQTYQNYGVIYMSKYSKIYSSDLNFIDCYSTDSSGGIFFEPYTEGFIYNNKIYNLKSQNYGGVYFLQNSKITFSQNKFENCFSGKGGVIYADLSLVNITDCAVDNSNAQSEGGFLFATFSYISIENLTVSNCSSDYIGGVFSLYNLYQLFMANSYLYNNSARESIVYINGNIKYCYLFENLTLKNNYNFDTIYSKNSISLFTMSEGSYKLSSILFENNTSETSLISASSSFFYAVLSFNDMLLSNNTAKNSLLIFQAVVLNAINISIKNNDFTSCLISFQSSNFTIINSSVIFTETKFSSGLQKIPYIFSGLTSNLFFQNSYIDLMYKFGGVFCYQCGELSFISLNFSQCINYKGGAILVRTTNVLLIINSSFIKNKASIGGALYIDNTNLKILESIFNENLANTQINDIYVSNIDNNILKKYNFSLINCSFKNSSDLFLYVEFTAFVFISYSCFQMNQTNQALSFRNNEETIIYSSFFQKSSIYSLNVNENKTSYFHITNSTFEKCLTDSSGASLSLKGLYQSIIMRSIFRNNVAGISGGAIYINCISILCSLNITQSYFIDNIAYIQGGAIKIEFILSSLDLLLNNNIFSNNFASLSNDLSTGPFTLKHSNSSNIFLTNSGQSFQFIVYVCDQLDNILITQSKGNFIFQLNENESNIFFHNNFVNENEGVGNFTSLIILGFPGIIFKAFILYQLNEIFLEYSLTISLLPCSAGQIYLNLQCLPCESELFSIEPEPEKNQINSCELCPNNAVCPGGKLIIPNIGYWRYDDKTKYIVKCSSQANCIDQTQYYINENRKEGDFYDLNKTFEYICAMGSTGNLCAICKNGYGADGNKNCVKCEFYKYFIVTLISILFLLYQTNVATKINPKSSQQRSLLKLLINHNYYLSFLVTLPQEFSQAYSYIFGFINEYLTAIPNDLNNLDCVLGLFMDTNDYFATKLIFYSFFPIIISVFLLLIKIIISFLKVLFKFDRKNYLIIRMKIRKELNFSLVSSLVVTIYSFYSRILNNNLNLLRCIRINDYENRLFLEANPNIICWSEGEEHLKIIYFLFIPNFTFWCIGCPIFLFMFLRNQKATSDGIVRKDSILKQFQKMFSSFYEKKHPKAELRINPINSKFSPRRDIIAINNETLDRKSLKNIQNSMIFQFLTIDYKDDFYYWESFFYLTMLMISIVNVLSIDIGIVPQVSMLIFIYFFMLLITEKAQPFKIKTINQMACFSYVTIICTVSFYLMANLDDNINYPFQKLLYNCIIILVNCIFYLWVLSIFSILFLKKDFVHFKNNLQKNMRGFLNKHGSIKKQFLKFNL